MVTEVVRWKGGNKVEGPEDPLRTKEDDVVAGRDCGDEGGLVTVSRIGAVLVKLVPSRIGAVVERLLFGGRKGIYGKGKVACSVREEERPQVVTRD